VSYCPRCGIPGGGSDKSGRSLPNHVCGGSPCVIEDLSIYMSPETIARMEREEAEQREFAAQLAATIAAEIAEVERLEAERDVVEERRQSEMRNLVKRERTV
jgi:transcription initiation factor TFIIIB Brf1 subunit/transcription initiation factor TFIIB